MSTLAAVVGDDPLDLADWNSQIVHRRSNPFTQFHAKFWGVKEVADTEVKQEDEGDMKIDDPIAEDDDIDPSCYVLDIGIRGAEQKKIWVRAEYIRMFNFAEEFYAGNTPSCLVITGQPGIGKSLWRWYALRRCCAQKKPVIFYSGNTCWLFVEEGVFKQPTSFYAQSYNTIIWTLVDSVDAPSGLPIELIEHGSQHFVIYTTSPTPSTWNKLHQSMERVVCVMNPWTRAEIHKAAPFRAPGMSIPAIDAIFNELGPIPRQCFGKKFSLIQYRQTVELALCNLTLHHLENLSTAGGNWALDDASHTIYMLRRSGAGVDSVEVDVMAISPFMASKVVLRLQTLQHHELVRLFKRYIAFPSARRMLGDVFKAYCHVIFSTKIDFDFVPMVRIGGRPQARERESAPWFSSHTEFKGSAQPNALELEVLRISANEAFLDMYPSHVVDYDSDEDAGELHIEADVYYIPVRTNEVGIDSFILHDNNLYLLQMTVSDTHAISDELLVFLVSLKGLPPKSYWRFIFVKPPGKTLACPVPRSAELWDLNLYSAEVEVK